MRRQRFFLAAVLLVGGCSASTSPPPSSPAPSIVGSPVPTPTPDTTGAAAAYSHAADPYNRSVNAAKRTLGAKTTLAALKTYYTAIAKVSAVFQASLAAIAFPPDAADEGAAMIAANDRVRLTASRASGATTSAQMATLSLEAEAASEAEVAAAKVLREALGLPRSKLIA